MVVIGGGLRVARDNMRRTVRLTREKAAARRIAGKGEGRSSLDHDTQSGNPETQIERNKTSRTPERKTRLILVQERASREEMRVRVRVRVMRVRTD